MTTTAVAGPRWAWHLNEDPLSWLLDAKAPAVRHRALRELLGMP